MNFETITDLSGASGDRVKIGWCTSKDERFKCVEKAYTDEDSYKEVVVILENFKDELQDLGPDLIWNNDKDKIIYLEYIHSKTVKDFVANIDLDSEKGRNDYTYFMNEVVHLLKTMDERDICHRELHTGNVLVRDDMKLKIVDIDTVERKSKVRECWDEKELVGGIFEQLNWRVRRAVRSEYENLHSKLKGLKDLDEEVTPSELKDYLVYEVKRRWKDGEHYDEDELVLGVVDMLEWRVSMNSEDSERELRSKLRDLIDKKYNHDLEEFTNNLREITPHEFKHYLVYRKPKYGFFFFG